MKIKKLFIPFLLTVLLAGFILFQQDIFNFVFLMLNKNKEEANAESNAIAQFYEISNIVKLKRSQSTIWNPAEVQQKLATFDAVSTGEKSSTLIEFNSGYFFKLGENSLIAIEQPPQNNSRIVELAMNKGTIQGRNTSNDQAKVKIKAGNSVTEVDGKSEFGIRLNDDNSSEVWVNSGSAFVTDKSGQTITVNQNEHKQFNAPENKQQYIFKEVVVTEDLRTEYVEPDFKSAEDITSTLSRAQINKIITQNKKKINTCYQKSREKGANASININIRISTAGTVESVNITNASTIEDSVAKCVLFWMKSLRFPKFSGDKPVEDNINFVFD
jgi:hypothetical protein